MEAAKDTGSNLASQKFKLGGEEDRRDLSGGSVHHPLRVQLPLPGGTRFVLLAHLWPWGSLVQTTGHSSSSDILSAAEGSSVLTSLIRNHQFTCTSVETAEGPAFPSHSGLYSVQVGLEEISLPSALLQFNFACKLNLPQGIF